MFSVSIVISRICICGSIERHFSVLLCRREADYLTVRKIYIYLSSIFTQRTTRQGCHNTGFAAANDYSLQEQLDTETRTLVQYTFIDSQAGWHI